MKTLDASLPSQRLEDWLQSGLPQAQLYWSMAATCDLKPVSPNEDYPLCAKLLVIRNGQQALALVQIGTFRKGIVGRPELHDGIGVFKVSTWVMTGSAERLSDLPALFATGNPH